MTRRRIVAWVGLGIVAALGWSVALFRARYCRTVMLHDLTKGVPQTVSVAFLPHRVDWKLSGTVSGTGVVVVSCLYSNQVSGSFSVVGGGDYYATNASVVFLPEGAATGRIKASFRFHNWY